MKPNLFRVFRDFVTFVVERRFAVVALPIAVVTMVALPLVLDQPFGTQTPRLLAFVYALRRWSPAIAAIGAAAMLAITVVWWRRSRRLVKAALVSALAVTTAAAWFARENPFDQLTYAAWLEESPDGRVLAPDARIAAANRYAGSDWEERMQKTPAPRSAANDRRLQPRALIVGVEVGGAARAYPLAGLRPSGVVLDTLRGAAIAIVRGPDGRSTRVFDRTMDGRAIELVAKVGASPFRMADLDTGSEWDFAGVAVGGPLMGRRLGRVPFLEEYWFDWKTYHPSTDVARHIF